MFEKMRRQEKKEFNSILKMRNEELKSENLILLHDIQYMHDQSFNKRLKYKWRRSLRVIEAIVEKKIYLLKELDDVRLNETFVENRIKEFYQHVELHKSIEVKDEIKEELNEMKEEINEKLTHLKERISKEWSFVMLILSNIEEALF